MAEGEKVLYEVNKQVAVVTLCRPQSLNALDASCLTRLLGIMEQAGQDPNVHAVLITGSGDKAFCAGLDVKMLQSATEEEIRKVLVNGAKLARAIFTFRKPTAVVINGLAMAWGMIFSMLVDFRFVADDPKIFFAMTELDAGIFPATAAAFGAVMTFGVKTAQEMLQTGKRYSVPEMQAFHFITAVYPRRLLLEESIQFLGKIACRPPNLLYMSKTIMNMHAARIFDDAMAQEYEFLRFLKDCNREEDVAKFLEDQWTKLRKR